MQKKEHAGGQQTSDTAYRTEAKNSNTFFLQQLSTEIRASLSQITALTEDLKLSMAGSGALMEQLDRIKDHSNDLYQAANSIIDYTELSEEKLQLENAPFSVKSAIGDLITELNGVANRKNVYLFTNVRDAEDVQVQADRSRFEQIIRGYIEYAIEHSPTKGNVFVVLRYQYLFHNTMKVIVEMETVGKSMYHAIKSDMEYMRRKTYLEKRYGGKGINLYICTRLLKKMGGTIAYTSQNEYESRISLSFDMQTVHAVTDEDKKTYSFDDERVLILDVDHEWKEKQYTFFREIGLAYSVSDNFEEAMDLIGEAEDANQPYDICILKWGAVQQDTMEMVNGIRSVFGNQMTIMALTSDETVGVEINKREGLNYIVAQSWIRSLIFDTLIKLKKSELGENKNANLPNQYNFENRRVLLAEDVFLNAELIMKMLNLVNISVTEAMNGLEAVSIYNKKPEGYFNCILMDINMPVMDGYAATKEIRNSGRADAKTIPIFAMTANAMPEDIQLALDAGMDGHIAKPVDTEKLYDLLNKTFNAMENDQFVDLKKKADELQQKNDELLQKAEHDHLTGLLNRHGFERKTEAYRDSKEPLGLMLIDLDKFKGINDTYGHQIGDRVLHKLAVTLQKYFRATDDIIRFGGDEFAVILTNVASDRSFVLKNVDAINKELSNPQDGLPAFSISTGAAFSENGYSEELYAKADEALYVVKENGRCGCKVYSGTEETLVKAKPKKKNSTNAMLYIDDDEGRLVLEKEALATAVLEANSAVGTACGFYDERLSGYFVSKYILNQLGYTYDEFMEVTGGSFKKLLHPYDRLCVYELKEIGTITTHMLRMLDKNAIPIWFRVSVMKTYASDGRKMWFGSFRAIDTSIVQELCESNCVVVGVISCIDRKIMIEKGVESLKGYSVEKDLRYDYDTLLRFSIDKKSVDEEKDLVYQKACLDTVEKELKQAGSYSFVAKRLTMTGNPVSVVSVRYHFRYIDHQQDAIVCTQEFL